MTWPIYAFAMIVGCLLIFAMTNLLRDENEETLKKIMPFVCVTYFAMISAMLLMAFCLVNSIM